LHNGLQAQLVFLWLLAIRLPWLGHVCDATALGAQLHVLQVVHICACPFSI